MVVAERDEVDAELVEHVGHDRRRLEEEALPRVGDVVGELADDGLEVDDRRIRHRRHRGEILDDVPGRGGVVHDGRAGPGRLLVPATEHHVTAEVQRDPLVAGRSDPVEEAHGELVVARPDRHRLGHGSGRAHDRDDRTAEGELRLAPSVGLDVGSAVDVDRRLGDGGTTFVDDVHGHRRGLVEAARFLRSERAGRDDARQQDERNPGSRHDDGAA